jgi:hypothetical protein
MPPLDSKLRDQLDKVCQTARDLAVSFARSALQKRGVDATEALPHFGAQERELRNRLRARGRQVGDVRTADGTQSIEQLSQELAYEYWHRMLFARFLAENNLLMHPDGVAVSLEECEELAASADPPAANGFVLAARYASAMLPQIFRTDDVLLEIEFAPEQRLALEKLLASLPKQTFEADDSLGWVYQFWQTAEKKRVNDSGEKIDGRTLPAVTQLFTEHYMVEFLLHNTIGAWWCAKEGIQGPPGGAGIPPGKSPVEMPYLRWRDTGTPAAGKFEGWPKTLAEFTMLDPCCGSGHFLVAAFNLLVPLRMHDEGLSATAACDAVLRENIYGLELDSRCTQIAAFALAMAAWKYRNAGGYRRLPALNIACSGQGVTGKREEWLALANNNHRLREGMDRLYDLFQQAPHLGSLIDPRSKLGDVFVAGFTELQPLFLTAINVQPDHNNQDAISIGVVAKGIATAAQFLSRRYVLVATNVPYLGQGQQKESISDYLSEEQADAKADLATAFASRALKLLVPTGSSAMVLPQGWLFLSTYRRFRERLLRMVSWNIMARLGPGAFATISGEVVNVILTVITQELPQPDTFLSAIDSTAARLPIDKAKALIDCVVTEISQRSQLANPSSRITLIPEQQGELLESYASYHKGICTGDYSRFGRCFWELADLGPDWSYQQTTVDTTTEFGGCEHVLYWQNGTGQFMEFLEERLTETGIGAWVRGRDAWGKTGIAISSMGSLPAALYQGSLYDNNVTTLIPHKTEYLPALWAFCRSQEFAKSVRQINKKLSITDDSFVKVPFDYARWRAVAANEYPNGLPIFCSSSPTQWLFSGKVRESEQRLHVAVAKFLGYLWPEQSKTSDPIDSVADIDGIVCLPGIRGEPAAADRLLELLHLSYVSNWSDTVLETLLTEAGCKAGTTLNDWLRNQFFEQHCKLFHNRPFIWHIWDGRKDGFSALVNYHKLNYKVLENLTYSYLGDWIAAQSKSNKAGADLRLAAAQSLQEKLKLILTGEPPYDIFVRWKPLHEQAIGWNPDLNDGVRMNIRPFMQAGILRKNPNIKWTKDRGKEPLRDQADYPWFWSGDTFVGDRVNDIHLTNAVKEAARKRRKGSPS